MFKRVLATGAILALLSCGACVSTYVQPADSLEVAHITFNRMPGLEGLGHVQQLLLVDGPQCQRVEQLDSFSPISSNFGRITERQVRLPGGKETHLVALTVSSAGMNYSRNCKNMASFTPRAGGRYQVTQILSSLTCRIDVVDSSTNTVPADLRFHPVVHRCTENLE